jgi:surface carbohydrate biosynthesis protein
MPRLLRLKFSIDCPKHRRVVFIGSTGESLLRNYIAETDVIVYRGPRTDFNVWIAFFALITGSWSIRGYYKTFLRLTKPDFVITFEDNALEFYLTKVFYSPCTTICIQNGRRDSFSTKPDHNLWSAIRAQVPADKTPDFIFAHGSPAKMQYDKAVGHGQTQVVAIGSMKNNALDIAESCEGPQLFFVSSFPNLGSSGNLRAVWGETLGYWGGSPITFGDFYKSEGSVALESATIAASMGLPFVVLGKRPSWQIAERNFFASVLSDLPWTYLPAKTDASSYQSVSLQDIVVSLDSTFGYEMFGRGVRVAFVSGRMHAAGLPHIRDCEFGYPYVSESSGPFWTNTTEPTEVKRVLHNVISMNDVEWSAITANLRDHVMPFDFGNQHLCHVLTELGVRNFGPRTWDSATIPKN